MALRPELKNSENYHLIAGLDEDGEAQELTFDDDRVKVSVSDVGVMSYLHEIMISMKEMSEIIIEELRVLNAHLSILTDEEIKYDDN